MENSNENLETKPAEGISSAEGTKSETKSAEGTSSAVKTKSETKPAKESKPKEKKPAKEKKTKVELIFSSKNGQNYTFSKQTPPSFNFRGVNKTQAEWLDDESAMEELIASRAFIIKMVKK